ncbi:glutamyl-tRNA reductase [Agromyces mediolanus]|uniref:glutamyl-tRNA reductase n=1 Tax=Agromyces mediolanus TaxID=41986 RepID=UPI00203E9ED9|nr:glutamyl-tRNA reductase [Agromyces mediolanus]MCM3659235.1 glutamyl-tRNA reductase [Agromyces mediolanus]
MLICLSASHKNAGFDMLERLSASADAAAGRIVDGHAALQGAIVVATCNRFEAYLDLATPDGDSPVPVVHEAIRAVGDVAGLEPEELRSTFDFAHGNAVAGHLFSVASGLESVVVGEGEIAGQVRRSLERARDEGTTTPELERLFQRASQTSRTVKNRTGVGSAGRSLVRLALELASSRVADWSKARVLLVGTGQYAGASLAALRDRGADDVRVYSPSGRAARFARNHGIEAVSHAGYAVAAAAADVIITCTTADHHVVDRVLLAGGKATLAASHVAPADAEASAVLAEFRAWCPVPGAARSARQLVIDLGMPRNVATDVVEVEGVELLDLETIRRHAPLEELGATEAARELVNSAARNFGAVGEELDLAPSVVALRAHVGGILDAEIARAKSRGQGDPDGQVERALRHMAGVLLHTPMVRSREFARSGEQRAWIEALDALFGVRADGSREPRDA